MSHIKTHYRYHREVKKSAITEGEDLSRYVALQFATKTTDGGAAVEILQPFTQFTSKSRFKILSPEDELMSESRITENTYKARSPNERFSGLAYCGSTEKNRRSFLTLVFPKCGKRKLDT
ncbi:hypothetical protein NQ317_000586 [Molorchus minor]|uniref:Uncharacterized protein n=1 Tax=Molorchus minor TaxID=1323400 RepID=A0ABQ9IXG5_9CUCU|nr:hypothetical protein NQ317_000586 [Molorchus minor]